MNQTLKRIHRVPLMLNDDEVEEISEFRFRERKSTQAEAIRELIREGLASKSKATSDTSNENPI